MSKYVLDSKLLEFLKNNALDITVYNNFNTPLPQNVKGELNQILEYFPDQVDGMILDEVAKEKLFLSREGIELQTLGLQYTIEGNNIMKKDTITNSNEPIIFPLSKEVVQYSRVEDLKTFNVELHGQELELLLTEDQLIQIDEILNTLNTLEREGIQSIYYGKHIQSIPVNPRGYQLTNIYVKAAKSPNTLIHTNDSVNFEIYNTTNIQELKELFKSKSILYPGTPKYANTTLLTPQDLAAFHTKLKNSYNLDKAPIHKFSQTKDFALLQFTKPGYIKEALCLGVKFQIPVEDDFITVSYNAEDLFTIESEQKGKLTNEVLYNSLEQKIDNIIAGDYVEHQQSNRRKI